MGIKYKGLILAALSILKVDAGDEAKFERLAIRCMQVAFKDITVLPSSGISAGGDCGRDGIFFKSIDGEKGKIAVSTRKDWREKLKEEIKKTKDSFRHIVFCSNQKIDNKEEDDFIKKNSDYDIKIFGCSKLADIILNDFVAQGLLEIPRIKNELTVEQLRNFSQLKKEHEVIENYIPRNLLCDSEKEPINILSLFRDCDLNTVTIIDSPAGHGKTGALKYAYYHLLFDEECYIPPFFFPLDHYRDGDLRAKIEEIEKLLYEEKTVNYFLLIDGIDNLTSKTFHDLLHELDILLNTVQSCYRKVIMTGRTGEYEAKIINEFFGDDVSYYTLAGLTKTDINAILDKQLGLPEECRLIIQQDLEQGLAVNSVFYVTKLIDIYKKSHKSHLSLIQLLQIVSDDELKLLYKGKEYDLRRIQQLSLYMTTNRLTICNDKKRLNEVFFPGDFFSFSHKTTQEYLSAKELAEMDYQSILSKVSSFGLIIPYLKNTVGLLLSILISEGKKKTFEQLISFLERTPKNYYVLFKIESDSIEKKLVGRIVQDYIEAFDGYDWTIRNNEELFNFICYDIDSNCSYLLSQIKKAKDETRRNNLLYLCYEFVLCRSLQIPPSFSKELLNLFFAYLDCNDYSAVRNMIWTVSYLNDSKIENHKIDCLISKVFSLWEYDVFVPFLRILSKNNYACSPDQIYEIFKTYWEIEKHNRIGVAHFVSPIISSTTEYEPLFTSRSTYGFAGFLEKNLVNNQQSFSRIIGFLHEELQNYNDFSFPLKDEITSIIANCFVDFGLSIEDCYKIVMDIVCSLQNVKAVSDAFKNLPPALAFSMIKYKYEEKQGAFVYGSGNRVFEGFYQDVLFKDKSVFSDFLSFFSNYDVREINGLLGYYCCNCCEQPWFRVLFPKELYESFIGFKEKQRLYITREIQYKKQLSKSFTTAFSREEFLNDFVREVFFRYVDGVIPKEALFHLGFDDYSIRSNENPFACFVVERFCLLHNLNEYDQFVKAISSEYSFNILWLLLEYFKTNSLSPSIIKKKKNVIIEKTINALLLKYPFDDSGTKENNAQRLVIELFQKHFTPQFFYRKMSSGNTALIFHIAMDTAELNYTLESEFDYLTSIVGNEVICSCVLDKIESISDDFELNKACRVLTKLCNSDVLKRKITEKASPVVYRFMHDNLIKDTYASHIIEYARCFNITVFDFQQQEIESGFFYDKRKRQLGNTLVADWMSLYKEKSEQEISLLCTIFKRKLFRSRCDDEKRVFAEMLLFYDTNNLKAFKWLARYLIHNDNCCLSEEIFGHRGKISTNNYSSVNLLNKLYKKSFDYHSELKETVQRFVISSINAIAKNPNIRKKDYQRLIKKTEKLIRYNAIEIEYLIDLLKENYANRAVC